MVFPSTTLSVELLKRRRMPLRVLPETTLSSMKLPRAQELMPPSRFGMSTVPVASVPMKLWEIRLRCRVSGMSVMMLTPAKPLPEITFASAGEPPTRLSLPSQRKTPYSVLPRSRPSTSRPIVFAATVLYDVQAFQRPTPLRLPERMFPRTTFSYAALWIRTPNWSLWTESLPVGSVPM